MNGKREPLGVPVPMAIRQRLGAAFSLAGPGIHQGVRGRIFAAPAPWGTGLVFRCGEVRVPVGLDSVRPQRGSTVLTADGAVVHTPEHLLAALVGAGITDAVLTLDGPEVPILDGSSGPWLDAIAHVGVVPGPSLAERVVRTRVEVSLDGGTAAVEPFDGAEVRVSIGWDDPRLPRGALVLPLERFAEVARARTFVLASEIAHARAAGRGGGANADNTVVVDPERELAALRFPDEVLRHKLLDAIGDLALVGAPFRGRLTVDRGSHRLHAAVLEAWRRSDPRAWTA
ncbi:MAG: UDP-3-O-acyl-N-acetylglucosamine deacetylase [Deltaproteobacteria bacterium]|nr:UDP-3-O-acyl-N-acetylglucosamine deacetylase [Deltaproteobacteria bacterium]